MTVLLFALLLAQISPPPVAASNGIATGVVLSPDGTPSAGIRVYAILARDSADSANNPIVFEGLAETDANGHYRLEVPTGRYYIAAGSVQAPTYFPDTATLSSAKQVLITAGTTTEGINFSKYIAAIPQTGPLARTILFPTFIPVPQPPDSKGVLSGFIRFADGKPASSVAVIAVPLSTLNVSSGIYLTAPLTALSQSNALTAAAVSAMPDSLLSMMRLVRGTTRTFTDSNGHYRLENIWPESYYIMAGNSESPIFYPGTPDLASAKAVTTTPTTMLDTLNITITSPSQSVSIRGRTLDMTGEPAGHTTLEIQSLGSTPLGIASLLPTRTYKAIVTGIDGSYEIPDVGPGSYFILAKLPGAASVAKSIVVADQSVNLNFDFQASVFAARVLWEDGSPILSPLITEVAVRSASIPNIFDTIGFSAATIDTFKIVLGSGKYQFFIRDLPQGYTIKSIRSGITDLIKEPIDIGSTRPSDVEVRISKAPAPSNPADIRGKVRGQVLDAATGSPQSVGRLQLCCMTTGPFERMSAAIGTDGSFEFSDVPPGQYSAELRTTPSARIVDPAIDVGSLGVSGRTLVSSAQFVSVVLNLSTDGVSLPPGSMWSVTFASDPDPASPEFRITKSGPTDELLFASVPAGVQYTVTISNLPAAFKVKSMMSRSTDLMSGPLNIVPSPSIPVSVQITLTSPE